MKNQHTPAHPEQSSHAQTGRTPATLDPSTCLRCRGVGTVQRDDDNPSEPWTCSACGGSGRTPACSERTPAPESAAGAPCTPPADMARQVQHAREQAALALLNLPTAELAPRPELTPAAAEELRQWRALLDRRVGDLAPRPVEFTDIEKARSRSRTFPVPYREVAALAALLHGAGDSAYGRYVHLVRQLRLLLRTLREEEQPEGLEALAIAQARWLSLIQIALADAIAESNLSRQDLIAARAQVSVLNSVEDVIERFLNDDESSCRYCAIVAGNAALEALAELAEVV